MAELDESYVRERVENWIERIQNLYSRVQTVVDSAGEQLTSCVRGTVTMHEELMQNYNVAPVKLPLLEVSRDGVLIAKFKPVGLWVIGANGRVDVITRKGSYLLVDTAEPGANPKWEIYEPGERSKPVPFDTRLIRKLVSSEWT